MCPLLFFNRHRDSELKGVVFFLTRFFFYSIICANFLFCLETQLCCVDWASSNLWSSCISLRVRSSRVCVSMPSCVWVPLLVSVFPGPSMSTPPCSQDTGQTLLGHGYFLTVYHCKQACWILRLSCSSSVIESCVNSIIWIIYFYCVCMSISPA